jgi:hypothetical protein
MKQKKEALFDEEIDRNKGDDDDEATRRCCVKR